MENLKKNKFIYIFICIGIVSLCLIGLFFIDRKDSEKEDKNYLELEIQNETENNTENSENDEEENNMIYVHIAGEVVNPGVVIAKEGDRIQDIIEKAGGVTELANLNKVNLAYKVEDGQKINIPNINDKDEEEYVSDNGGENVLESETALGKNGKVNINTATQTELETLSGIGPSTASKIIKYREENGKFKNIEDIKNVSGIGDAKYKNIEDSITVK